MHLKKCSSMKGKLCVFLFFAITWNAVKAQEEIASDTNSSLNDKFLIAADAGDTVKVLSLIKQGADVDAKTWMGVTSLMYATQNADLPMMKILIRCGADLDLKPANGNTALLASILNGTPDLTEFLIRNGASVDLGDNNDVTPLMYAIKVDTFFIPDLLLYYGADFDAKSKDGTNALMLASLEGRSAIAEELITMGAEINSVDNLGNTALHFASRAGHTDIMEMLIAAGAAVEARTGYGYTPLSVAVVKNNYEAARLLIGAGADVNSPISNSLNPLTIAHENHFDSLALMLQNNGAKYIVWPWFNQTTVGGIFEFNGDDMFTGINLGLSDKKYNLWVSLGYKIRPKYIRVLVPAEANNFYQYHELRQIISGTLDKAFFLKNKSAGPKVGLVAGIEGVVTFASYQGSGIHPRTDYIFSPHAGAVYQAGKLRLRLNYAFMDLNLAKMSDHWCSFSIELLIDRKKGTLRQTPVTGI
jgi:ankyrin repeat protein